jgi:ankyrin repeat protein
VIDFGWLALTGLAMMALAPARAGKIAKRRMRVDQALCDAASIGELRRVKRLLEGGVNPDSADEDGTTALMAATFAGQARVVRVLLDAGADPDIQDISGMTAMMNAVIANGEMDIGGAHPIFVEIIELLIAAGADVQLEDQDGMTAAAHADACDLGELAGMLESP